MSKTYVKIDDDMPANAKVRTVSVAARWAYVSSICYAGHNRTSGVIPVGALALLDATAKLATELLTAGLWEKHPQGYYVHDYPKHNRTREEIEAASQSARTAGAIGLAKRYGKASEPLSIPPSKNLANSVAKPLQARSDPLLTDPSLPLSDHKVTDQRSEISASETLSEPLAKRELRETILAAIPAKFRYDDLLHDEVDQFVADYPEMFTETVKAIAECRRERELPFPGNLRKHMPKEADRWAETKATVSRLRAMKEATA